MKEKEKGLPIPPVMDEYYVQSLHEEIREAMLDPFAFGYRCGNEWTQTVHIEYIHEATFRLTVNEQIDKGFKGFFKKVAVKGMAAKDTEWKMPFIRSTEFESASGPAISNFFKEMEDRFYFFKGYDDTDETEKNYQQTSSHDYALIAGIPNFRFRAFEDGWTMAVRDCHRALLQNYLDRGDDEEYEDDEE